MAQAESWVTAETPPPQAAEVGGSLGAGQGEVCKPRGQWGPAMLLVGRALCRAADHSYWAENSSQGFLGS